MKVRQFESRESLDAALAERFKQVFEISGSAVMLSGGKTPQQVYERVAGQLLKPARELQVLYSDERYVASNSAASNYYSSLPLLNALALPEDNILRVRTELPLEAATLDYERRLQLLLNSTARIQLGLLGLGTDGHTASLFSEADLDNARGRLAISVRRPDGMDAITVTPQFLAHIKQLIFLVAGADKRAILAAFIASDSTLIAARAISGCQNVEVWCDAAACADV